MKTLVKTGFKPWILICAFLCSPWAGATVLPVDPCYSPLEIAALFSANRGGKPSLKSQITKKNKLLKKKDKELQRLLNGSDYDEGIEGHKMKLRNSLDSKKLVIKGNYRGSTDKISRVARGLTNYMESRQGEWNCEKEARAANDYGAQCRPWQDDEYFGSNGNINPGFCADYASENQKDCEDALTALKRGYLRVHRIENQIREATVSRDELEDRQWEIEHGEESDEEETGGRPICIDCLQDIRALNKPSGGQIFGNALTMGLGAALSVFGVREARRSASSANELLALQGHPARNNFGYSMAGLSAGFPFMAKGLHGLTQANAAGGGYGCSQTSSPYAPMNPMMAAQMRQHQMQQMQFQGMMGGSPYAMGGNPMMQFQMQNPLAMGGNPYAMGGNPYAAMGGNPMMQFQMQNPLAMGGNPYAAMGGNPMMQFQMQNPLAMGGNPYAMGGNPMMQFQMQNPLAMGGSPYAMGGSPYAMGGNPYAMGGNPYAMGGNPYAMGGNPMMQMPGMNPAFSTQYSQQAIQQMKMQIQMQKAHFAQQQSAQQEWMQRKIRIGHLVQEIHKIKLQINLESMGGINPMVSQGSLNTGLTMGQFAGPGQGSPPVCFSCIPKKR